MITTVEELVVMSFQNLYVKAREATYNFFWKFYIISYLQSFVILVKFLWKELVHYLYRLCCIKKKKR